MREKVWPASDPTTPHVAPHNDGLHLRKIRHLPHLAVMDEGQRDAKSVMAAVSCCILGLCRVEFCSGTHRMSATQDSMHASPFTS
jgi:hypothetical protein